MPDLAQYWQDLAAADKTERRWMEGVLISKADLKNGTGNVEIVTIGEWFGKGGGKSGGKTAEKGPLKLNFGKYKGRLASEVQDEDPNYWNWAIENVDWFRDQAKKAGLIDE